MAGRVLGGVPETALWTLRNRAEEAARPDSYFHDPQAVRLYGILQAEYEEDFGRFGKPSQSHPLRALVVDDTIRSFLAEHPHGPVVALGEGLQTTYWRLGRPEVAWYSVDVPEMVEIQRQLLPPEEAIRRIARSALDRTWLDEVPAGPAMVTAEGLFMYLPKDEVHALVADLAAHFPGGRLLYDSIPGWSSAMTLKGKAKLSDRYVAPAMPTAQTVSESTRLPDLIPGVASARDLMLPPGRGSWASPALRAFANAPLVRDQRPSITLLTFSGSGADGGLAWSRTQGIPSWTPTRDGRSLYTTTLPGPEPTNARTLPTVVFEAGAGATRSCWALVQPLVAELTRAVAYDRSGLGRSAPDPAGPTLTRMADDLNDLLDQLDKLDGSRRDGPGGSYVLVGHSDGGPIVRLATSRRPERIVGLVLVDPTDEAAEVMYEPWFRRVQRAFIDGGLLLAHARLLRFLSQSKIQSVPPDVRRDLLADAYTPQVMATWRQHARTYLDDVATWRTDPPELGDIPVTVISATKPRDGLAKKVRASVNAAHAYRATQSPHGRHILAENSGHDIPYRDPQLIAAEVRRLITGLV
ncbi:MAG: alpha/beta fold hydrolase [Microlunatus sp.]